MVTLVLKWVVGGSQKIALSLKSVLSYLQILIQELW